MCTCGEHTSAFSIDTTFHECLCANSVVDLSSADTVYRHGKVEFTSSDTVVSPCKPQQMYATAHSFLSQLGETVYGGVAENFSLVCRSPKSLHSTKRIWCRVWSLA